MPYKIAGNKTGTARIIIIDEDTGTIDVDTVVSGSGAWEFPRTSPGTKIVIGRATTGHVVGYGNVVSLYYLLPFGTSDRGIFAGGYFLGSVTNIIDIVSIATTADAYNFGDLTEARTNVSATSNGANNRGIFGGTYPPGALPASDLIDYITISSEGGTATDFGDMAYARGYYGATSNGTNDRGVFGGGRTPSHVNYIDYVTISSAGNASYFGALTRGDRNLPACSNGTNNRGVFGGGVSNTNVIDYITISSSGNATNFGDLTEDRYSGAATSNGTSNRGVFLGGHDGATGVNTIDYITITSTGNATDFGDLTVARYGPAACSNGTSDRGISGGGYSTDNTNVIDYITISTPGNAADFGDLTEGRNSLAATSNA